MTLNVSRFFWPTVRLLPLDISGDITDYEFLLSVCTKLNQLIESDTLQNEILEALKKDVETLQQEMNQIQNGDFAFLRKIIENAIRHVWFGITQSGYFCAYVPSNWDDLIFKTTGLDIVIPGYNYGHLVLQMEVQ